jgi:hypothetical protein
LIGTDAVRSIAGSVAGQAQATGQAAAQQGNPVVQSLLGQVGAASGAAQAASSASGSFASSPLTLAGSLAAQGQGALSVERGTSIFAPDGRLIGSVSGVVANAQGEVEQLIVTVDGARATLPSSYFQTSGSGLVSAAGEGQIKQMAEQQQVEAAE